MDIDVGRQYRVRNAGGAAEVVTAEADWEGDIFLRVTIVPPHPRLWLRIGGKATAPPSFCTIEPICERPVAGAPRPFLGDDPGALEAFRRTFRGGWDFSTGTY